MAAAPGEAGQVGEKLKELLHQHLEGSRFRSFWADVAGAETEEEQAGRVAGQMEAAFRHLPTEAQREAAVRVLVAPPALASRGPTAAAEAELLLRLALVRLRGAGLISLKAMCEALILSADVVHLSPPSVDTFLLLKDQLPKLDYKGVRDILKQLLERLTHVPPALNFEQSQLLANIEDVVLEIVDRENNYLPAYFVMNELYKLAQIFQHSQTSHHRAFTIWRLAEAFGKIFDSFRPLARIVSVVGRWMLTPVTAHRGLTGTSAWKLDPHSFRYIVKGSLPYSPEKLSPQSFLLYTLLKQPRGKELITHHVFGREMRERRASNAAAVHILSDYVALAILEAMAADAHSHYRWLYLANIFVHSILGQFASFTSILGSLISKLRDLPYRSARDELTWVVLQYVSGIGKNLPAEDGELVLSLYKLLYTGEEELLTSGEDPACVKKMAPTCLWVHLKAQGNDATAPPSVQTQMAFLEEKLRLPDSLRDDQGSPLLAVICNAYSSDVEKEKIMAIVLEGVESGDASAGALPAGPPAFPQTRPLSLAFLDSLTLHAKIVLATHMKAIINRPAPLLSPAALESYARLISTTAELDANKTLIMQIFPAAVGQANLPLLHVLCELMAFRLPPNCFAVVFKSHSAVNVKAALQRSVVSKHPDLYSMLEQTLLRQALWSHSTDFIYYASRVVGRDSDVEFPRDVGRVLVLCMSRAINISAASPDTLQVPPDLFLNRLGVRSWPASGLALFPASLRAHFEAGAGDASAGRVALEQHLQDEYIMWRSLGAEQSLIEHFARPEAPPVFFCLMFKILKENNQKIPAVAYKIMAQLSPKTLVVNLQKLVDYLIKLCIQNQSHQTTLNAMIETVEKLIWTWWLFPVERLVVTMVMGDYEEREAQAAMWIVHWLLSRSQGFSARVSWVVARVSANPWTCEDQAESLKAYSAAFPTRSWAHVPTQLLHDPAPPLYPTLPVYFAHIGLTFLPAADLLIMKAIELAELTDHLFRDLIDTLAPLYKFHPQPGLFLSSTLMYYETCLAKYPDRRRYLVLKINGALEGTRPPGWLLTDGYRAELGLERSEAAVAQFTPGDEYFSELLRRMEEGQTMPSGPPVWAEADWRFSEFANPGSQAMHGAAVEFMSMPMSPNALASSLINHLLNVHLSQFPKDSFMRIVNNAALLLTALPNSFHSALYGELESVVRVDGLELAEWAATAEDEDVLDSTRPSRLLALSHAFHQHAAPGTIQRLPAFFRDTLVPLVRSEAAFLFAVRAVVPFLYRLHQEKQDSVMKVAVDVYKALVRVDAENPDVRLKEDLISDLLYHLKYMFVGDGIKNDVDGLIEELRPSLKEKLKFISPPPNPELIPPSSVDSNSIASSR